MSAILARIAAIYNPTTKKYATELIRAARAEGLLPEGKVAEQVAQLLDAAKRARQRQGPNYISASKWSYHNDTQTTSTGQRPPKS